MADSSAPERPTLLPAVEGSPPLLRPTPMVSNTPSLLSSQVLEGP